VRWVAPVSGNYDVSGLFQRIDTNDLYSTNVDIVQNGDAVLFSEADLSGYGTQSPFAFNGLFLTAGTTLDFAEGAPQAAYDSTGLSATITLVPEPATAVLSSSALLGLGLVYLWRRRKTRLATQPSTSSEVGVTTILSFPSSPSHRSEWIRRAA
jgi:hypothetical protein